MSCNPICPSHSLGQYGICVCHGHPDLLTPFPFIRSHLQQAINLIPLRLCLFLVLLWPQHPSNILCDISSLYTMKFIFNLPNPFIRSVWSLSIYQVLPLYDMQAWYSCMMVWFAHPIHQVLPSYGMCYVNCDSNNWHFCANLSLEVLPVWDGDSAHMGDVWKPSRLATPSQLWSRVPSSSYQLLRHWQSHASGKQATVDTCWLLRDNDRVLSRKGDSDAILSSSSEKAFRSGGLQSKGRLIST